jgi:hypothetical protein
VLIALFQIIMLSASANKLSKLKDQAEEYAALIMEELDPEGLGYIEVNYRFLLAYYQAITILWFP